MSGESGVKMNGPYDYVAPAYWEIDPKYGGAWGFSTEIGPGPAIPPLDSMRKFLPEADIWPHDDAWRSLAFERAAARRIRRKPANRRGRAYLTVRPSAGHRR